MDMKSIMFEENIKFVDSVIVRVGNVFRKTGNTRGRDWYLTRVNCQDPNNPSYNLDLAIFDNSESEYNNRNFEPGEIIELKNLVVDRNPKGTSLKKTKKTEIIRKGESTPKPEFKTDYIRDNNTISNRPDINNLDNFAQNKSYLKEIVEELKQINKNLTQLALVILKDEQ